MKNYKVTLNEYHESFTGYDHYDGDSTWIVEARNFSSAGKKAQKEFHKMRNKSIQSCWCKVNKIVEVLSNRKMVKK